MFFFIDIPVARQYISTTPTAELMILTVIITLWWHFLSIKQAKLSFCTKKKHVGIPGQLSHQTRTQCSWNMLCEYGVKVKSRCLQPSHPTQHLQLWQTKLLHIWTLAAVGRFLENGGKPRAPTNILLLCAVGKVATTFIPWSNVSASVAGWSPIKRDCGRTH